MAIKSPYTRQIMSYSPQRSAGIGRRGVLPNEYAMGYGGTSLLQPQRAPAPSTLDQMLYSPPPVEPIDMPGGGVGIGGEQAEGMPNAVDTGFVSQEVADTIEGLAAKGLGFQKGSDGWEPTIGTLLGIQGLVSEPATSVGIKGGKALIGMAVDAFSGGQPIGMEGGIPAAQGFNLGDTHGGWGKGPAVDSDMAPPSSLADIGFDGIGEGGGYDGGGYGMPGGEGVGGIW